MQARWVQARLRHLTREACPPGLLARPRRPCHDECPRGLHRAMAGPLRGALQNLARQASYPGRSPPMPRAGWKSKARCWAGCGAGRPPSDGSGGQCTRQPAAKVQAGSRRRCCRWYLAQGGHKTCRKGCKRQVQNRAKAGGRAYIFHVRRRRYRRAGPSRGLLCSASIGACGGCPQRGSSRPRRACHRACHQAGRQAFDTAPRTSRRGARQRKTGGQTSSRAAKVA